LTIEELAEAIGDFQGSENPADFAGGKTHAAGFDGGFQARDGGGDVGAAEIESAIGKPERPDDGGFARLGNEWATPITGVVRWRQVGLRRLVGIGAACGHCVGLEWVAARGNLQKWRAREFNIRPRPIHGDSPARELLGWGLSF
jgi:hypothetical protein